MSRFTRVLAWAFPAIPRDLASRIQTPVVGARGRASATGDTPAPATSTPAGAGQTTVAPAFHGAGGSGPGPVISQPGPAHRATPARRDGDDIAALAIEWRHPS